MEGGKGEIHKKLQQKIKKDTQLLDCRLVCKDGDAMASRAVLAAHSSLMASALTGEPDQEEVLLPEASIDHLRPLLSVLHGLYIIDQVNPHYVSIKQSKILLRIGQMTLSSWLFCWGWMVSLL